MKVIVFLLFCSSVFAQYTNIPDANFERKLIGLGLDTALDGKIQTDSISSLEFLDVSESSIKDLTGISDFKALKELICYKNELTSLDLSQNSQLTILDCSVNSISILKVTKNEALIELNCSGNRIHRLEMFKNPNLEKLDCSGNKLTYLDFKNCQKLLNISATYNLLREIDLRNYNKGLSNNLVEIDLRYNRKGIMIRVNPWPFLVPRVIIDQEYICASY